MKSFLKHGICLVMTLGLAACSGSKSHQALNDFSYLETAKLHDWRSLPDQKTAVSQLYAIPASDYSGSLGENVNILPPVQLLKLVSTGRYKSSPYQAIFMLPDSSDLESMNEIVRKLVEKEIIPLEQQSHQNSIETKWVKLDDDRNGTQARYLLTPIVETESHGIQVTLLEAQRDGENFEPNDQERERFNILMANTILLQLDIHMRQQANRVAQGQLNDINIALGTDRNGNSVIIARSSYEQFWNRLPTILEPLGFTIDGRNRSQGTIELDYSQPDEKILQRLNVKTLPLENSKYQLQLGDLGNRTSINVLDNAGKPLDEASLVALSDALIASMNYTAPEA